VENFLTVGLMVGGFFILAFGLFGAILADTS
jgi:hypothetical protein